MSIKKKKDGRYFLDINRTRAGIPRVRKYFDLKDDAEQFEREYLAQYAIKRIELSDTRTLRDLVDLWHKYHGINLADGDKRKRYLHYMCDELKNPVASSLTPELFVDYRHKKLNAGMAAKTFNNRHGYLSAVYNKLRKLKVIDYENPIVEVDFIKIQQRQLSYLSYEQIELLLCTIENGSINQSTWYVAQICLRTGARWGEAEQLKRKQLHDNRVTFEFTKSKKTRTVPLEPVFFDKLMDIAKYKNPDDRIFKNCISAFRRAVDRAEIDLPRGQMTHILRHTFASHFIISGGNILSLQKILGHSDINQTMKYAHLAPDYSIDAVRLNPIQSGYKVATKTANNSQ